MQRIDPHAHTQQSDGTDTPSELVLAAKKAGLDVVAITDHDSVTGWQEAQEAAHEYGVGLLPGAELSAAFNGQSVHILGYLMDPTSPGFLTRLTANKTGRIARLKKMVETLKVEYPTLTWDQVLARSGAVPPGRPHLADTLISLGYFPDRNSAFAGPLSASSPHYLPTPAPTPLEVVELINSAGGVAILAHPLAQKRGKPLSFELVETLTEAGLYGIERDHREHSPSDQATVDKWARTLGLAISGGSDYHGKGKPNRIGENLMDPNVLKAMEERAALKVTRP